MQVDELANRWEVGVEQNLVTLRESGSMYKWVLSPDEAWDLGDDLMIAGTRLMPFDSVATTTMPAWADEVRVSVNGNRMSLICDHHGVFEYVGPVMSVGQILQGAQGHWHQQHSSQVDVAEHAEGEDGQADAQPSVPEAQPDAEAVADAHGGGDQVQNDLKD